MSDPTLAPLIVLDGVSYAPQGARVLDNLSFTASERRIGIVGRNGSGKTSLARMMAGLIAADTGTVRIAGIDVATDRKAALGVVGILFQNPDHQIIFPTVDEEIAFGLTQMGHSKTQVAQAVTDVLAKFDKAHWAGANVHQLSQGQRHLVCLMAVLVMSPRVIILDEPFAGLDIPTIAQLRRVLAGLDVALVLITHQPDVLDGFDRVLWIEAGQVLQDGPAPQVIADFTARMAQIGGGDDLSHLAG